MIDENEGPVETRVHEARQKVQEIKRRRQRSSTLTRIFVLVVLVGGGILAYLLLQESFEPIEEIEVEEEIVF
jgi:cell division septal protein FtsQ